MTLDLDRPGHRQQQSGANLLTEIAAVSQSEARLTATKEKSKVINHNWVKPYIKFAIYHSFYNLTGEVSFW